MSELSETSGAVTIRSFRIAFELERRLFKIDRWRLPLPYGVPLRGAAYAAVALAAVVTLGRAPLVGPAIAALPPPVRFVLLPAGAACLLVRVRVDGRCAHTFAVAWLRSALAPRRLVGFRRAAPVARVYFSAIPFAPDERTARYRRGAVSGPARLTLRYPARGRRRGRTLFVRQRSDAPLRESRELVLKAGERVVFR